MIGPGTGNVSMRYRDMAAQPPVCGTDGQAGHPGALGHSGARGHAGHWALLATAPLGHSSQGAHVCGRAANAYRSRVARAPPTSNEKTSREILGCVANNPATGPEPGPEGFVSRLMERRGTAAWRRTLATKTPIRSLR